MVLKIVEVIREQVTNILVDVPDDWPESKCFKIPTSKLLHSQVEWETDDTYIGNVESGPTADDLLSCECFGENGGAVKVTEADLPVNRYTMDNQPPAIAYDEDAEAYPED